MIRLYLAPFGSLDGSSLGSHLVVALTFTWPYSTVVTMKGMSGEQKKDTIRALLCEAGVAAVMRHPALVAFHDLIFEAGAYTHPLLSST
jgi:hypothetical protein